MYSGMVRRAGINERSWLKQRWSTHAFPAIINIMLTTRAFTVCVALTVVASGIALRIEYLNARLGGYLPQHQGKWRFASRGGERLREEDGIRVERLERFWDEHGRAPSDQERKDLWTAPLTSEEIALRDAKLEAARPTEQLRRSLYSWLLTAGLLQYPLSLCCLLWAWSFLVARPPKRIAVRLASAIIAAIAGTCLFLALNRDYFGSLGWWDR